MRVTRESRPLGRVVLCSRGSPSPCAARTMTASETSRDISERTSGIVRIAYHQLSVMCGTHEPTGPASSAVVDANAHDMVCTRRLLDLPLFAAATATLRNAYAITKGSHEAVATILGHAEDGVRASLQFASPVTDRVADALETPLKAVDDAVCVGLDYVEEKVPSVKLPPGQIYANMRDCVRNIFTSALETLRLLFGGPKNQIEGSPVASGNAQEESRRMSS